MAADDLDTPASHGLRGRVDDARKQSRGVTRRNFLITGGAAAGLVVAWAVWPREYGSNLTPADNEQVFGAYLKISSDGLVTVAVPQSEMGQGVYTVLPQILADELGADWRTVAVEPAPINPLYANRTLARDWAATLLPANAQKLAQDELADWVSAQVAERSDFIVTAGSTAITEYGPRFREAGAAARVALAMAAAERWSEGDGDVTWESLTVENGIISDGKRTLKFGDLADEAAAMKIPSPVPLRPNIAGNLVGQDIPRLDLPSKLDGSANFAGDIRLPDMVYASIRQGPVGETKLKSFNREGAAKITGLIDVIDGEQWIAAVATNWWAANSALDKMSPVFETTAMLPSSEKMDAALAEALDKGPGTRFVKRGETGPAFDEYRNVEARYEAAPALHAPMETRSATAQYTDGRLELWVATQAPEAAVQEAARALGIGTDKVTLHPMLAGGSFGRNLDSRIAGQVAVLAQKVERPVQLVWSRAEELIAGLVRAPAHARLNAATDIAGRVQAMQVKIAAPAFMREQSKRLMREMDVVEAMRASADEADRLAVDGADAPYAIANFTLDHHPAYTGLPAGSWRSDAHSTNAFFIESFIDELAAKAKVEPLSYRMQMMSGRPRLARCLTGVAAMAGWDGGVDGSGMGLACHSMRGGHIAVVVSARRDDSGLKVRRISATVDIGRIVHPDIARQQVEGGIIFGLAMAMGSSTTYQGGLPAAKRLSDLSLPRLGEIPAIQVEFIKSEEEPVGPEEIGVPAVAPAVANALFSATGTRFRQLPLFGDA